MTERMPIVLTVNRRDVAREVPVRLTLADFLRHELELTGTHLGCEHGVCGRVRCWSTGARRDPA
jgi:carbon-monoxide dehydrogenase small subunit